MNEQDPHNPADTPDAQHPRDADIPADTEISRASLIRAAADGEPWAIDRLGDDAADGGVNDAAIASERVLRERVAAVMGQDRAPEALRASIAQMLSSEPRLAAAEPSADEQAGSRTSEVLAKIGGWVAAAAVLGLAALVVLQSANTVAPVEPPATTVRLVSGFIVQEHDASCDAMAADAEGEQKFTQIGGPAELTDTIAQKIGVAPPNIERRLAAMQNANFELFGIARCPVPGFDGETAHLLFQPAADRTDLQPVSVMIQHSPDSSACDTDACFYCAKSVRAGKPVAFWRAGDFLVFVHAADDPTMKAVTNALGAPTTEKHI